MLSRVNKFAFATLFLFIIYILGVLCLLSATLIFLGQPMSIWGGRFVGEAGLYLLFCGLFFKYRC